MKTRLAAEVGEETALQLYRAMLADVLAAVGPSDDQTLVEVMWTGGADATGREIIEAFGHDVELARQSGATLGDRLAMAFSERVVFHEAGKIIAIGTDDPALDRRFLDRAFLLLDSCDWVIGPATDGGYYLIGARGEAYRNSVFADIAWGTATVFQSTLDAIRRMKSTVAVLPMRNDIDTAEDLRTFLASREKAANLHLAARGLEVLER